MAKLPNLPTSLDPNAAGPAILRYTMHFLLLSLAIFAIALALRRAFFWDIKPVSWDFTPPQNGALEAAFLLLSIENVAAVVAAIAFVFVAGTWVRRAWIRRA